MTTFYAKSKMAYPEYRYNILNTDFKPVYETDGRLRLGGKSVVFTKADTEEKVITVHREPDIKHTYTIESTDGSTAATVKYTDWKPFRPKFSVKTSDAEFIMDGSAWVKGFEIHRENQVVAKITRPGLGVKYGYIIDIMDEALHDVTLGSFIVLSHYIGGRRSYAVPVVG
ncbi:hypothetical protein HMPREF0733_11071 [Rothia dentocariosa ATCC 17931]|uniref:Uncharacterized protein n=1 Tax=Rothia dentocariosa (strain ATCC 17931 / CDC X599 / XDIA) TaxID=762948 RepID=E3H3Y6_ROTDC|nr:hypothetical protein [Rothia dentocariosa]ADP40528.1 hypothetical protein HMPREF0733_11071 [Rothia dentocariosa ATCC 17931]WMS31337.1 hypothetical protein RDV56_09635 [Rothia dentocariosa]SUE36621.1 Uncharacterised protein [Rothia dentocariosa]